MLSIGRQAHPQAEILMTLRMRREAMPITGRYGMATSRLQSIESTISDTAQSLVLNQCRR